MKCLEEKPVLKGTYDSSTASFLTLTLELCDPDKRKTCKSREKIKEWLKGKFIILLENNWKFRSNEYN